MGHKLHLDENEKLGMFGVTHVLAIDGFSSKMVAESTMPVKNNLVIYEEVYRQVVKVKNRNLSYPHSCIHIICTILYYRKAVANNGMWDQIRVDHGREFYWTLYMQEKLSQHRHNISRLPYVQTTSSRVNFVLLITYKDNNYIFIYERGAMHKYINLK